MTNAITPPADLLNVGAQLANIAFNWSQRPGYALTSDDVAMLDKLRREWDTARAALASPAPAAPAEPVAGDQFDPENSEHWCPHCGGSGDVEVPDGAGPDAHMVPANCPHCEGVGTLYAAYRGVVKLLQQERQKYSKLLGEWYFLKNKLPAQPAGDVGAVHAGWQPIETAPKDGSLFLCWVAAVRYGETDEGQQYQQDASQVDFCSWRDGPSDLPGHGYFDPCCGQIADSQGVTHWMHLPAAPKE